MKTIALFGTSADPPTGERGHRGIVKWLTTTDLPELEGRAAEVWVLPVYQHVFEEKRGLSPFHHRMQMARLNFSDLPRVRVLPLERERPTDASGTADLLDALRRRRPNVRYALALGEDTWRDLRAGRWRRSEAILERTPVVVLRRPGDAASEEGYSVPEVEAVSSTDARAGQAAALYPPVRAYVARFGLYPRLDVGPG